MHAYTYSGHPTCCAVALANIDILERERLVERAAARGATAAREAARAGRHRRRRPRPRPGPDGGGRGGGRQGDQAAVPGSRSGVAQKLTDALLERGLYTRVAMDCICLAPPLVTSDALLDRIVDTVREAIPPALDAARKELSLPVSS